ncbi:MAG TPA: NUDIX hydrolase [Pseudonocardiaceae bacterium]|nr:NUDIX hydrolase [Pseudonocardiaceae bacterium]
MGLDAHPVNLRCSALVFREDAVLLCQRITDWVVPGGTPEPGEAVAACVRREVREETGLAVTPVGVAFVLDATNPDYDDTLIEVMFLAEEDGDPSSRDGTSPRCVEDGLLPRFVPLDHLARIELRPPIAGHIRAFHAAIAAAVDARRPPRTAAYLGNVWRPAAGTARRAW